MPVICHGCKTSGRYAEGALWRCRRCGGVTFALEDPAFRRNWWEHFNDILLTDHTLERLADNPVARRLMNIKVRG